jgi:hypothetical protein
MHGTISLQRYFFGAFIPSLRRIATITTCSAALLAGSGLLSAGSWDAAHAEPTCDTTPGSVAFASGNDTFACGPDAEAVGTSSTAIGDEAKAGSGTVFTASVIGGTAVGSSARASDDQGTAIGAQAEAGNLDDNPDNRKRATALGFSAGATQTDSIAVGANAEATGIGAIAVGSGIGGAGAAFTEASGDYAVSIGFDATADSTSSIAVGDSSTIGADSMYASAYGANTSVGPDAPGAVAIGTDSDGHGAAAALPNQYVMGTVNHTYTAPGITSATSKARQSGPLEVVTSDASGNLATDGGQIFATLDDHGARIGQAESQIGQNTNQIGQNTNQIGQNTNQIGQNTNQIGQNTNQIGQNTNQIRRQGNQIAENQEGVAVAMSANGPDLVTNESFGLSLQWGGFEGAGALGGGMTGVIHRGETYRMALTGGIGVGLDEGTVGGRAGGQITW